MRRLVLLSALAACGRVGFHELDAAPSDAAFAVGCADGEREALLAEPTVAGCSASWQGGRDLRAPATGASCGDDLADCANPSNACATGWHPCAVSGHLAELAVVDVTDCVNAGAGAWVAASSHCATNVSADGCVYPGAAEPYPCFPGGWCSEPICCGTGCSAAQQCGDALYAPGMTGAAGDLNFGCGMAATNATIPITGVLCCRG